jgi:predicted TPR repeat methyltransferase
LIFEILQSLWPLPDPVAAAQLHERLPGLAEADVSGDVRYLRRSGLALWGAGALSEAYYTLKLAALHEPGNPSLLADIGSVLFAQGRLTESIQILKHSLALDAQQLQVWVTVANIHRETGASAEAEDAYRAALMLCPDAIEPLAGLGLLLAEQHRHVAAAGFLQRAVELGADDPALFACLGQLYYQLGDFSKARVALQKSVVQLHQCQPIVEKYAEALLVETTRAETAHRACKVAAAALDNAPAAIDRVERRAFQTLCVYGPAGAALDLARAILARCPDDPIISYHHDALAGQPHMRSPDIYVKTCFDRFSDHFDSHLVDVLDYRIPEKAGTLLASQRRRYERVLDLGCGTGLAAPFAMACGAIDLVGVDLSPGMLTKAAERRCYSELREVEAGRYLRTSDDVFDLVLCLDVLVYFGDLDAFFHALVPRVAIGGDVVISFETSTVAPFTLAPSGRFAHAEAYVEALIEPDFETIAVQATPIRLEANRPVPGSLYLLRRRQASAAGDVAI